MSETLNDLIYNYLVSNHQSIENTDDADNYVNNLTNSELILLISNVLFAKENP